MAISIVISMAALLLSEALARRLQQRLQAP